MENKFYIQKPQTDEWYTHRKDVKLIIPYLVRRNYKRILCPFDTEKSNFVKELKLYGFDVIYSHIDTGTDFFNIKDFSNIDCVVSNPPFSIRTEIIERLFAVKKPFALLQNINGLFDSKKGLI